MNKHIQALGWLLVCITTCATLHAQTVIVKGTGAGAVRGTGAGSVRAISATYCSGRFAVNFANTAVVIDNDSGLMWTRNANIDGTKDWTNAGTYCDNLTNATYTDWRLPSYAELSRDVAQGGSTTGLIDAPISANDPALPLGHPFTNVQSDYYWSSTVDPDPEDEDEYALSADLITGFLLSDLKVSVHYVWPCRGP